MPAADRVVNIGMKWALLVKESTTTNITSWPNSSGSFTMKSTLTIDELAHALTLYTFIFAFFNLLY